LYSETDVVIPIGSYSQKRDVKMKRYHKWSIYRNVIMLRYLFRGCDGVRQHVQMMRWIHDKGLTEVFDFIKEHFEETWTMPIQELNEYVNGRNYHDQ
ncbi:hypothetical protein, partial [[Clostridium] innocuum]